MAQERNLLFGVLAVQLKLATPQQLVSAAAVWAAQQESDLVVILVEQGVLTPQQSAAIMALIDAQADVHAGDVAQALQSFGGDAAVQQSFCGSIVFDAAAQSVRYAPLGGDAQAKHEPELQQLGDTEHLTSEHPGRYSLRGEKGRGGIGRVLIAFDEHIGREIALKELLPDNAAHSTPAAQSPMRQSATLTARFLREARITGQLEHPGIVPVYEVGRHDDGTLYYTMKLVRGETMAERLKRCKGIADRLALLPHFLDLCQAIAYAHSRGVIHRDIKPANVMLGEFGETVLLDWGLAKVRGLADEGAEKLADEVRLLKEAGAEETVAGKPIGTPSYMPPEQADGRIEDIDERSDVWSLGAVLYEILTGQPPYIGATALEVVGKVLSEPVTPALTAEMDTPSELSAVAMRCLNHEQHKRYQRVTRLAEDVASYLTGGLVSAYQYNAAIIAGKWLAKHKGYAITLSVLITVLILSFIGLLIFNDSLEVTNMQIRTQNLALASEKLVKEKRYEEASLLASVLYQSSKSFPNQTYSIIDESLRTALNNYPYTHSIYLPTDQWSDKSGITNLQMSKDAKTLVLANMNGRISIINLDSIGYEFPQEIFKGFASSVSSMAILDMAFIKDNTIVLCKAANPALAAVQTISPNTQTQLLGKFNSSLSISNLYSCSQFITTHIDGSIKIWDSTTLQPLYLFNYPYGSIIHTAISENERVMACSTDSGYISMISLPITSSSISSSQIYKQEGKVVTLAYFGATKSFVSATADGCITLWPLNDPAKHRNIYQSITPVTAIVTDNNLKAIYCALTDGSILGLYYKNDQYIPIYIAKCEVRINCMFLNYIKRELYCGLADGKVVSYPLFSKKNYPIVLRNATASITSIAYNQQGTLLAFGTKDGRVVVYDIKNNEYIAKRILEFGVSINYIKFLENDVDMVLGSNQGYIYLHYESNPKINKIYACDKHFASIYYDRYTKHIFTVDNAANILEFEIGKNLELLNQRKYNENNYGLEAMDLLTFPTSNIVKTSKNIYLGSNEGFVLEIPYRTSGSDLWITMARRGTAITSIEFSNDESLVSYGSNDGQINVFGSDKLYLNLCYRYGTSISRMSINSSKDQLAAILQDGTCCAWLLNKGTEYYFKPGLESDYTCLNYGGRSGDIALGRENGTVEIWSTSIESMIQQSSKCIGRNLSSYEWNQFFGPDQPYKKSFAELPVGFGVKRVGEIINLDDGKNRTRHMIEMIIGITFVFIASLISIRAICSRLNWPKIPKEYGDIISNKTRNRTLRHYQALFKYNPWLLSTALILSAILILVRFSGGSDTFYKYLIYGSYNQQFNDIGNITFIIIVPIFLLWLLSALYRAMYICFRSLSGDEKDKSEGTVDQGLRPKAISDHELLISILKSVLPSLWIRVIVGTLLILLLVLTGHNSIYEQAWSAGVASKPEVAQQAFPQWPVLIRVLQFAPLTVASTVISGVLACVILCLLFIIAGQGQRNCGTAIINILAFCAGFFIYGWATAGLTRYFLAFWALDIKKEFALSYNYMVIVPIIITLMTLGLSLLIVARIRLLRSAIIPVLMLVGGGGNILSIVLQRLGVLRLPASLDISGLWNNTAWAWSSFCPFNLWAVPWPGCMGFLPSHLARVHMIEWFRWPLLTLTQLLLILMLFSSAKAAVARWRRSS